MPEQGNEFSRLTGDWIGRANERMPANSVSAYAFALCTVVAATLVRVASNHLGATLLFAPFFPAVLITAIVAGPRAASFAAILSALIAWLAFMPHPYALWPLGLSDAANLALFLGSSGVIIWFSAAYRRLLTRLTEALQQRAFLMREMEHRAKNTFLIVETIVRNTLASEKEKAGVLLDRLRAVSDNTQISSPLSVQGTSLRSLVEQKFAPHGADRYTLPPTDLMLTSDEGRHLALVLHEMVTNAAKYGALANPDGRVDIDWEKDGTTVTLLWKEHGAPTTAAVPAPGAGFGTRLIKHALQSLSGTHDVTFTSDGLVSRMTFQQTGAA